MIDSCGFKDSYVKFVEVPPNAQEQANSRSLMSFYGSKL
jgi:hypothetical protein